MRRLLILGSLFAGCLACREPPEIPAAAESLFAPQLVALDVATPYTRFDGITGSMLPERGWAPVEEMPYGDSIETFSWATGESASVWVEGNSGTPMDFLGHCRPMDSHDGKAQTLTLHVSDREIGTQSLNPGWQEVRIAIPEEAMQPGFHELRLQFGFTRRPADTVPGSGDRRRLAAACRYLALVPTDVEDVEGFLNAVHLERLKSSSGTRRLHLALGTAAAFPLPGGREVRLRLGRTRSNCRRCRIQAEHWTATGSEVIAQARATAASGLSTTFSTPEHGLSRIVLRLQTDEGEIFDLERTADIDLAPDFLELSVTGESTERQHVFVIVVDTLRADALDGSGSSLSASPGFAAFAADAVVYENAWSASSWTLPSVVSILTGAYPFRHGVMQGTSRFSEASVPSLAQRMTDAGYRSLGISQSHVASHRFGIDTGFEDFFISNQLHSQRLLSQEVRRILLSRLLRLGDSPHPVFVYLHTVAPHAPYAPPAEYRYLADAAPGSLPSEKYDPILFMAENLGEDPREVAHMKALYDGEVAYADGELGRLFAMLRHLDLYDDSLIILLSDHGEEFGEHGGFNHGRTLYEELLRVPMIIKYPGSRWGGQVISRRVSTVDLVPTILQTAGIEFDPEAVDGVSMSPPEVEARPAGRRLVFAEVRPAKSQLLAAVDYRTIAVGDLKCIESLTETDQFGRRVPRWQAFDLGRDPGEQQPLSDSDPAVQRCRELLARWLASQQRDGDVDLPAVDAAALDELRALGYIE